MVSLSAFPLDGMMVSSSALKSFRKKMQWLGDGDGCQ